MNNVHVNAVQVAKTTNHWHIVKITPVHDTQTHSRERQWEPRAKAISVPARGAYRASDGEQWTAFAAVGT
jgi:hypothetical protein